MSKTLLVGAGRNVSSLLGFLLEKNSHSTLATIRMRHCMKPWKNSIEGDFRKVQIGIQELLPLIKICFSTRPKTWRFASCPTISSVPLWIHF